MIQNNTFTQFIPIELIKSNDGSGNEIIKFKSCVSTTSEDADGEFLDPSGFNYDKLLKNGVINWNHQSKSSPKASFLGKPVAAYSDPTGGWVEGELYSKLPMVQEVLALQKGLKEYGMQLGVSIEGQATERDPSNPKKVLKADITGLAITPTPKNTDTTFELIKGMDLKSLIDESDDNEEENEEKAMDSSAIAPITKESVDNDLKDLTKISKGEALEKIIVSLPHIKSENALNFYNLLIKSQIEMADMDKNFLQKALDVLGIGKKSEIEKSINVDDMTDQEKAETKETLEKALSELNKAMGEKNMFSESEDVKDGEDEDDDEDNEADEKVEKSINNDLIKGIVEEMVKDQLSKDNTDIKDSITKGFKALGTILLAQNSTSESLVKGLSDLSERLENIENQPQESRGAIVAGGYISKGTDEGNLPKQAVSKRQIVDTLMKGQEATGFSNQSLCNDIALYETTGQMSPLVLAEAKKVGLV